MARPTVRIPVWSSGGTNTDPGTGKEASGWAISEKPPAYWFNWLLNAIGQWLDYFASEPDVPAAGRVSVTSGTGALSTNTVGFNSSVTVTSSAVRLTFSTALSATDYAVSLTGHYNGGGNDRFYMVSAQTATYFEVATYDLSTGALVNPSANDVAFHVVVHDPSVI